MLDINLAREDCSFLRLMHLVSDLDVPLNNSSSPTLTSERSEMFSDPLTLARSESSPDHSRLSQWWRSGRINVCSPSLKGSDDVTFAAPASALRPSSPSRVCLLHSFIPFTKTSLRPSLVASLAKLLEMLLIEDWLRRDLSFRVLPVLSLIILVTSPNESFLSIFSIKENICKNLRRQCTSSTKRKKACACQCTQFFRDKRSF